MRKKYNISVIKCELSVNRFKIKNAECVHCNLLCDQPSCAYSSGPAQLDTACHSWIATVAVATRFHVFINFFRHKEHAKRDDEALLPLRGEKARYVAALHV